MTNMLKTLLIIYAGSSFCQRFKGSFKCFMEMSDVFILFFDIPGMGSAIPAKKHKFISLLAFVSHLIDPF